MGQFDYLRVRRAPGSIHDHPTLGNGLICHYSFEDNTTSTVVTDDHVYSYHGTCSQNTNLMSSTDAVIGRSFLYSTDWVNLPNISSHFVNDASLSMWLKLQNSPPLGQSTTGLCRFSQVSYPMMTAYPWWADNVFYSSIWCNNGTGRITVGSLAGGVDETTWHHLVVTKTGGTNNYIVYQNGSPAFTKNIGTTSGVIDTLPILGRSNDPSAGTPNYFDGRMDLTGVWNRVLIQAEVTALYNGGSGLPY